MMGIDPDSEEPDPAPPTEAEIKQFEEGAAGSGPSLEKFVVDVVHTPATPWNKRILKIFVKHFISSPNNAWTKDHRREIETRAKTHLKYMYTKYHREVGKFTNVSPEFRLRLGARRRRRLLVSPCLYLLAP